MQQQSTDKITRKLTVPIALLDHAFRNNYLNELRLFLSLKATSSGRIVQASAKIHNHCRALGYKHRNTISRVIANCLNLNLIGLDAINDVIYVRPFRFVLNNLKLRGKSAMAFECHLDKKKFKAWVVSSILTRRIIWLNRKGKKRVLLKRVGTSQRFSLPSATSPGLAVRYIQKMFNISYGKAHSLRKLCIEQGFFKARKQYVPFEINVGGKTYYPLASDQQFVFEQFPELAGRMTRRTYPFKQNRFPLLRASDSLIPLLIPIRKNLR